MTAGAASGPPGPLRRLTGDSFWATVGASGVQGIRILAFVVLAPLLGPEPYGLIAMATIAVAPVDLLLIGGGWLDSLIRRPQWEPGPAASLFWLHILVGALGALAILLVAPLLAGWFAAPGLEPVLAALATVPLAQGIAIVPRARLIHARAFRRLALVEFSAVMLAFAAGLALALGGAGAMALAALQLVNAWVMVLLLGLAPGALPAPRLRLREIMGHARIASHLLGANLVALVEQVLLRGLGGRMFGPTQLGALTLLRRLQEIIDTGLLGPSARVFLRRMAGAGEAERTRLVIRLAIQGCLLVWPLYAVSVIAGPWLIETFAADAWLPAVPLIGWLALSGASRPLAIAVSQLMVASGQTVLLLGLRLLGLVIFAILAIVLVGIEPGVLALAKALALRNWTCLAINLLVLRRRAAAARHG